MPLRSLLLVALAAVLVACAPAPPPAPPEQAGEMTMTITAIVDSTTDAPLIGDVYLDDHLVARAVSTTTFSLGPMPSDRIVRVEAPGYRRWSVVVRRHNPSDRAHRMSGPVKMTPLEPYRPAVSMNQG